MSDHEVRCWPSGSATKHWECEATIPDDDPETIDKHGWGWGWAIDYGSESGRGPFLMCPDHKPQDEQP